MERPAGPSTQGAPPTTPDGSSRGATAQKGTEARVDENTTRPIGPAQPAITPDCEPDYNRKPEEVPLLEQLLRQTSDVQAQLANRVRGMEERLMSMPTRADLMIASRKAEEEEGGIRQLPGGADRGTRSANNMSPYGQEGTDDDGKLAEKISQNERKLGQLADEQEKLKTQNLGTQYSGQRTRYPEEELKRPDGRKGGSERPRNDSCRGSRSADRREDPDNLVQGLTPHSTMMTAFSRVVDYRTYRLGNREASLTKGDSLRMIDLKRQIDGLYPAMRPFDGKPAIRLLGFLGQLRDAFDMIDATEAAAVRVWLILSMEKPETCWPNRWKRRRMTTTPAQSEASQELGRTSVMPSSVVS